MVKKIKLEEFLHLEYKDIELSFLYLLLSRSEYPSTDCYQYAKNIIIDGEKDSFAAILFHQFVNSDKCNEFKLFVISDIERYLGSKSNDTKKIVHANHHCLMRDNRDNRDNRTRRI